MDIYKTSFFSGIATIIKILSTLVINKFVAIYVGPGGLGIIGQFQNFSQIVMSISKAGINNGVTKYIASSDDDCRKSDIIVTSFVITCFCSFFCSAVLLILNDEISNLIFGSYEYGDVITVLGVTLVFFSLNQLMLSILNGYKKIKEFITINITQSLYGLFITSALVIFFGLKGALFALATNQSIVFIITARRLYKTKKFNIINQKGKFKRFIVSDLFKYSLMALTTAILIPSTLMFIRYLLSSRLGDEYAGYWQAIWYVSSMYLLVITTALSTYYLPKLSELNDKELIRSEVMNGLKVIVPLAMVLSFIVYGLKEIIVSILFSSEFAPVNELFKWQLIGDVIKISAWIFSYLLVSKAMTSKYIISEFFYVVIFSLSSFFLIEIYGAVGVTYSYAISYLIYLMYVVYSTRKIIF